MKTYIVEATVSKKFLDYGEMGLPPMTLKLKAKTKADAEREARKRLRKTGRVVRSVKEEKSSAKKRR